MQTSKNHHITGGVHGLFHPHAQDMTPYLSFNNIPSGNPGDGSQVSLLSFNEGYFIPGSIPPTNMYQIYDSPSNVSTLSNKSQISPQHSHSYISDPRHSPDSPLSGTSMVDDLLSEVDLSLFAPDDQEVSVYWKQVLEAVPRMDLKQLLYFSAQAISDSNFSDSIFSDSISSVALTLLDELSKKVSVCGSPIERLAAYMLEGLKARKELSGFTIYKKLRCEQPTGPQMLSYMHVLYEFCPYYQFGYMSSNLVIQEAMQNERSIHIIDFQIGVGTQWMLLFQSLANYPGGPPLVRITGVDDDYSAHMRGGGLELLRERLSKCAESNGVPFEFHASAMSGCEVIQKSLGIHPGEALAVNFPFMLHHMPDESVNTKNHRDRLLRLVKSLSPKVVTIVEQESNTNTSPFLQRFKESLDYYSAMFESIDVALDRNDKRRINAEQHCLARDIVNMIACENELRVERHELFGKWKARLSMADYKQMEMSMAVKSGVQGLMTKFNDNYRVEECNGALYLGWKNRALVTSSAWR